MRVFSCNLCLPCVCSSKSSSVLCSPSVLQTGCEAIPSLDGCAVEESSSGGDCVLGEKEKRLHADGTLEGDLVNGECGRESSSGGGEIVRKSSIKKRREPGEEVRKGRVKWMDILGKELVYVHEFEASESEDSDVDCSDRRCCACVIQ